MNIKNQKQIKLVSPDTGETYHVILNEVADEQDLNKVMLKQMVHNLELRLSQLDFALWVIDNLDEQFRLIKTQKAMSQETGISMKTIYMVIKKLCDAKILTKAQSGCYCVNPQFIIKDTKDNMGICYKKK